MSNHGMYTYKIAHEFFNKSSLLGHRNSTGLYSKVQKMPQRCKHIWLAKSFTTHCKNQVSPWPETVESDLCFLPDRDSTWAWALGTQPQDGTSLLREKGRQGGLNGAVLQHHLNTTPKTPQEESRKSSTVSSTLLRSK